MLSKQLLAVRLDAYTSVHTTMVCEQCDIESCRIMFLQSYRNTRARESFVVARRGRSSFTTPVFKPYLTNEECIQAALRREWIAAAVVEACSVNNLPH